MHLLKNFSQNKKQSKYRNKPTSKDGYRYDSILECKVGEDLELRRLAGDIKSVERQVRISFDFIIGDTGIEFIATMGKPIFPKDMGVKIMHLFNYFVDFVVLHNDNTIEFIEVKGMMLEPGITKFKLLEIWISNKAEYKLTMMKK